MRTRTTLAVLVAVLALVAVACGSDGDSRASGGDARTIDVDMRDIAFSPDRITVPAGEEVRLVFHNTGKVAHDAFIGDEMAQKDHEQEMNGGGMAGMHGDGEDAITVAPGTTKVLTHTFEAGDDVLIGCHQPGHYAGGMKLAVTVS